MKTLYLRNVPDEVVRNLERLAVRAGMSLSAMAIRAVEESVRRARDPAVLSELPGLHVEAGAVVRAVDEGRSTR